MPNWILLNSDAYGEWTDAAHWSGGIPSAPGSVANFALNYAYYEVSIFESANISVGQMNVTGNADITFRGSGQDSNIGMANLFFDNGNMGAASINVFGGNTIIFSPVGKLRATLVSNLLVNTASNDDMVKFDFQILGTGTIFKVGTGVLEMNGSKSFSGGLDIQAGTVEATGAAALGSGNITISNNAVLVGEGTIGNSIFTINGATGAAGSARIGGLTPSIQLTLTGELHHLSQGTLSFYSGGSNRQMTASFSSIFHNAGHSSFSVGGLLKMDDAYNAANLFNFAGTGLTILEGGSQLGTQGFVTTISNLAFAGEAGGFRGRIYASGGALNLIVNDSTSSEIIQSMGLIEGTAATDSIVVNILNNFSFGDIDLESWTEGTDTITFHGSANANIIRGSAHNDTINGGGGNDTLVGLGGVDTYFGGSGNDVIEIGSIDSSFVDGGTDFDTLRIVGGGSADLGSLLGIEKVALQDNSGLVLTATQFSNGLAFNAELGGNGVIVVHLSPGNQSLIARAMTVTGGSSIRLIVNGSNSADSIKGILGCENNLFGNFGQDQLVGGNVQDDIYGGDGIDKIRGDGGADLLTGGSGADVFKYRNISDSGTGANADTIVDFLSGTDRINFSRIDTNPGLAGDQAFTYIGTAAFNTNGVAKIRYVDLGADLRVEADVNGDGVADMHVLLAGAGTGTLSAADFVL